MQNRVFDAADILIDGQPVIGGLAGKGRIGVGGAEPGEIPG